jgi:hypothetical protein
VFRLVGYGQSCGDFFKQGLDGGATTVFGGVSGPVEFVNFDEVMGYRLAGYSFNVSVSILSYLVINHYPPGYDGESPNFNDH